MSIGQINRQRFRTQPLREQAVALDSQVDGQVLRGAKLIELGEVKDSRPYVVDEETLEQVVELASRSNRGMKARFTHPSMSDDGMGKYLGRWENPRIAGNAVVADLRFSDTAFNTPSGDLGSYVMALAEESPDMFGISLAGSLAEEMLEQLDGGELPVPLRFADLHAADVVDEPAATNGLFSIETPQGLPYAVQWILDTHFANAEPDDVLERFAGFLSRYYGKEVFTMSKDTAAAAPAADKSKHIDPADLTKYAGKFGAKGAEWLLEGKPYEDCLEEHFAAELAAKDQVIADLQAEKVEFAKQLEQLNTTKNEELAQLNERLDAALKAAGDAGGDDFSARDKADKPKSPIRFRDPIK